MPNKKNWIIAFLIGSLIVVLVVLGTSLIKTRQDLIKTRQDLIKTRQDLIQKENTKQRQFAREMFEKQKKLDDTAIQRKVADLKKAGINPILAARYFKF